MDIDVSYKTISFDNALNESTFKFKNKNNKLISLGTDDEKLLQKYKAIWTKIEGLKNIQLKALPVFDDKCITTKIGKYCDKGFSNFSGLNVSEDDIARNTFTIISIDYLLEYDSKYYLQVHSSSCAYKI